MTDYLNFTLLGVGNAAVYAALAIALVVCYRSSGVVNFATGALALHAAYTFAYLRQGQLLNPIPPFPEFVEFGGSVPFVLALLIAVLLEGVVGIALWLVVFRPLRRATPVAKAVASLGVASLMTALVSQRAGSSQILVAPIFPTGRTELPGGLTVPTDRMWLGVTIIALALAVAAMYRFTRFGMATRAASETEVGALVSGISPERIALVNWAISAMVAGVAGILISPLVPLVPGTYTLFIVPALAAAVLGRFSSFLPAVVGGFAIGMLQSLAVYMQTRFDWFPSSGVAELIPLVLIFAVLVVRGRPLPTRGAIIEHSLGRAPRPYHVLAPALAGSVVVVILLALLEGSYRAALITTIIMAVVSLSLVVVTGYCGQISLAQMTFAGAAAFLLSKFTNSWGIPFPIAPLLAASVAACIGVVIGLPALRIRGLLVGVVTLSLAVTVEALWFRNNDFNGGTAGSPVTGPSLFGIDLEVGLGRGYPQFEFGVLCLVVLVITGVGVAKLRVSRLGSAMLAVRANERSAAASGISVVRVKLIGFGLGAFIAGIGGCLLAYKQTNASHETFSALPSLGIFLTAYLAGITSVAGAMQAGLISAGGLVFILLDRHVELGEWYAIITAVFLIYTVIKNPEGIVGPAHEWLARRRAARAGSPAGAMARPEIDQSGPAPVDPARPPVLSLSGLFVRYGGVVAVDDVSFDVPSGSIVGLVGPNGAGKTTTMDALCGFAHSSGTVHLGGRAIDDLAPHRRAQLGLGRTFQSLDLYEDLSVAENVAVGQYTSRHAEALELDRLLASLGLLALAERPVSELSQGQRQLVSIARALAGRPQVLLLDEPAAGLDSAESRWLAAKLRVIRDQGVTILLVDHDMGLVLGLCDLIYVLDFGRLIASGTPAEIRVDPEVAMAYLGVSNAGPEMHDPATMETQTTVEGSVR
ncbi:MAG: branched-chain amino acid ABC transporter permease/ATP-binding protein [Ilumatobacteraceae bacterium]